MDEPKNPEFEARYGAVTDDDRQRVDLAMERAQGNRKHAAQMLGMEYQRLVNIIKTSPNLHSKWVAVDHKAPNGFANEIHRDAPVTPFSNEQIAAAEAVEKQDALLATGWKKLGFSTEQKNFLQTIQKEYTGNLRGTLDLTYGGMIHSYTKLLFVFEDLLKRIADVDEHPENYRRDMSTKAGDFEIKGPHEFRCELYDRLLAVSAELRKVNSDATKANWVRAQIQKISAGNEPGAKRKKPGWGARSVSPQTTPPLGAVDTEVVE